MIPIADDIPKKQTPWLVYGLIGFNLALFMWEIELEFTGQLKFAVQTWGLVPQKISTTIADAISQSNPAAWVALFISLISLLVGMFLHASIAQFLGNMLFLHAFGPSLEQSIGRVNFFLLYILGGIGIAIAQVIAAPELRAIFIGSNGAIACIFGAYLICFPRARIDSILPLGIISIPLKLPVWFYLCWLFVQQVFYSVGSLNISPQVNPFDSIYWMHALGLPIGACVLWMGKKLYQQSHP